MKILKFRAWDDLLKRYLYDYEYYIDSDGSVVSGIVGVDCIEAFMNDDFAVLEQFTGLKDKKGKEIYEGDIIQVHTLVDDEVTNLYRVYWDRQFLTYGLKCLRGNAINDELWQLNNSVEVIGNIHEKSELCGKEE